MSRSCEGLVALVTGASQGGTGRSVAIRLAAEGAKVGITARSEEGLVETLARIEEVGGQGLVLPTDLGDPDGGRATLVERTEAAFGPIDILVNNAVAHDLKPVDAWSIEELERYAHVNLWAPWLHMSQVLPGMRERGRGWILNLTSFSGELPPGPPFAFKAKDGSSMYGATKAALNRLTVAAAGENEGQGIAVNALTPQCAILTPRVQAGGLVAGTELFEPVETMAESALALCTGDAAELTGRIAFSLQLLVELDRPVFDLRGEELMERWQPVDLVQVIRAQEKFHAGNGWPRAFDFHRPHTPRPAVLDAEPGMVAEGRASVSFSIDLEGRRAVVTGAGQSIGRSIALAFAEAGATVAVNDIVPAYADAVVEEIRGAGGKADALPFDVTDHSGVASAIAGYGDVTMLVNNAGNAGVDGLVAPRDFVDTDPDDWQRYIAVNLFGTMHCTHAALPSMIAAGWGRIVTLVSDAGRNGDAKVAPYAAAKAGAAGFCRSIARESGRHGITANCVSLGSIETPAKIEAKAAMQVSPEREREMLKPYVIRRHGLPEDVAGLVTFLASPLTSWITGQTYAVNGGYTFSL